MNYYKGLDENLCGMNGFQYEIGKEFTADTDDSWHWLHFAKSSPTLSAMEIASWRWNRSPQCSVMVLMRI